MFKAKWVIGIITDFDKVKLIRDEVFVDEYGYDKKDVYDSHDKYAAHLIVTDDETGDPIATARICPAEHDTYVGDIAVRKKYRTTNYADFCLRMLLYKAQTLSGHHIIASVLEPELAMYQSFGFTVDSHEDGRYNIHVASNGVTWHSECGEMNSEGNKS